MFFTLKRPHIGSALVGLCILLITSSSSSAAIAGFSKYFNELILSSAEKHEKLKPYIAARKDPAYITIFHGSDKPDVIWSLKIHKESKTATIFSSITGEVEISDPDHSVFSILEFLENDQFFSPLEASDIENMENTTGGSSFLFTRSGKEIALHDPLSLIISNVKAKKDFLPFIFICHTLAKFDGVIHSYMVDAIGNRYLIFASNKELLEALYKAAERNASDPFAPDED